MRLLTVIMIIFLFCSSSFGQIQRTDFIGEWKTENNDSLYYSADTIRLYRNINHFYKSLTSYLIRWNISKKKNNLYNVFIYAETGNESTFIAKEKLRMKKTDLGHVVMFERNNQVFDKFKITDYLEKEVEGRYHYINEFRLMRFDNLSEQKLYKYVDSLIYKVYYDSTFVDSTFIQEAIDNEYITSMKMRLRNGFQPNPEPMILLNGYVVDNKDILKRLRLVETKKIIYQTNLEESLSTYGYKALNGIIDISISKKKFNEIWKNYGR